MKRPHFVTMRVAALAVLAASMAPLAVPSVPASAATGTSVLSVTSTLDPNYPRGAQHAAVGAAAKISVATLSRGITMNAPESAPGAGDQVRVSIQPPQGKSLSVGRFAVDSRSQDPALARVELTVGSTSEQFIGDVEILDLAANATRGITRFDIVFRNGTESPSYAYFGQMRSGQPTDTGAILSTKTIKYPGTPIGSVPINVTETVTNTTGNSIKIGTATVASGATTDFVISDDRCSSTTLAAGGSCAMKIGFTPTKAGPRTGIVTVPTGSTTQQISVAGSAPLGTTGITYQGDDYVSGGTTHTFPDGSFSTIVGGNSGGGYAFVPTRPYGLDTGADTTRVDVVRYAGGPLEVGTFDTSEATGAAPGSTAKYGLSVNGSGRGCGSYTGKLTVSAFEVDATGAVTSAKLSWTMRCTFTPGTMTGSLVWRDRADKTPPSSVKNLQVTTASGKSTASWTASTSRDAVSAVARLVPGTGTGAQPTSGLPLTPVTATSATLPSLTPGQRYTLLVWSLDSAGNVGTWTSKAITG